MAGRLEELGLVELVVHDPRVVQATAQQHRDERPTAHAQPSGAPGDGEAVRGQQAEQVGKGGGSRALNVTIMVDIVGMVLLSTLNVVLSKLLTIPMINYPTTLTIHSVFWLVPPSLVYGLVQWKRGKLSEQHVVLPSKQLVVLAAFLALGWLLTYYGIEYTPGPLQVLLNQCVIPYSMAISYVWLGTRYCLQHYLGMLTVLAGILVAISDELCKPHLDGFELAWVGGYMLSWVPFAVLTVYLEHQYSYRPHLDPIMFNSMVNALQLPFLIPLALPFAYLSRPPIQPSQLWKQFRQGSLCLLGVNSQPGDDCWPWAPTLFLINTAVLLVLAVPFYQLSKNGGSNLVWLASALTMPLADLCFSLPFLPQHKPFTSLSIAALVVIVLGLLVYGYGQDVLAAVKTTRAVLVRRTDNYSVLDRTVTSASPDIIDPSDLHDRPTISLAKQHSSSTDDDDEHDAARKQPK